MNPRIQELFEQTLEEFKAENKYATIIVPNPLKEKFAELIVQDCISQIAMIGVSNCDDPDVVWTVDKAIQNIRKYFGVEE